MGWSTVTATQPALAARGLECAAPLPTFPMRARLHALLTHRWTQPTIVALILLNAVTLGLETSATVMAGWGDIILTLDRLILAVFTLEVLAKLWAWGARFWRDPWNVFDFAIVAIALVPASGPISVLRVLRLLRLVRLMPKLRHIVEALLKAIPGIASIFGLLLLVFYVFAIIATSLFGETHPDWFGTLGASFYSLFQIMTLESWSMGIARPVMEVHPWAWAFFVPFILVSTFTVLNLFIAIMVDAMQSIEEKTQAHTEARITRTVRDESQQLHQELNDLTEQLDQMQKRLREMQGRLR